MRCTSAEFCSPCGVQQGASIYAVYTAGSPQSILCNNISYRNIQSSVRYISAQCRIADTEAYRLKLVSFSIPQSLHYIKKAQGCAEGRGLVPLCGFLTFQCDPTLCGVPQSMWHTQPSFRNTCGYTAGIPQSMCHIRPEFRSLCGYTAGASAAYALIISPYKI